MRTMTSRSLDLWEITNEVCTHICNIIRSHYRDQTVENVFSFLEGYHHVNGDYEVEGIREIIGVEIFVEILRR